MDLLRDEKGGGGITKISLEPGTHPDNDSRRWEAQTGEPGYTLYQPSV